MDGITPACAGKTYLPEERETVVRDHPRVCGKNAGWHSPIVDNKGSPPRVREKRDGFLDPVNRVGITPACAGKTFKINRHPIHRQDHPRVCGKN